MLVFRVPEGVFKRIEAITRNFFLAWSRNRWDLGTCFCQMECCLPLHGRGRPRGQKPLEITGLAASCGDNGVLFGGLEGPAFVPWGVLCDVGHTSANRGPI